MQDPEEHLTQRRVLASSASVATAGALFSGSATAAKRGRGQSKAEGLNVENLIEAVTVANGKAKVKGWARSPGKGEVTITTQRGRSASYGATEFAEDINQGVEEGFWTLKNRAGELVFDLTEKGRRLISKHESREDLLRTQDCGGKNRIENGVYYFDSDSADELVFGLQGGGGVFTIASIIVGALTTATMGPAVFAVAGVLLALGGTRLGQIDDGCGIKVDPGAANEVQPQDCDC